ncbi:MAG: hypothetical protein FD122_2946 [Stygiobacter sp.]|nr:MAG: hypothetical protein FD122_2946 [Stygiobacter sp.]KAF0211292.1 MAG: hypothetical protein FD178_3478 [Ignavibacteria bacterium]
MKLMKTYSYSIFAKFWYRYVNIAITLLLLFYTIASFMLAFQKWYYLFVALLNLVIIYLVNRFYINSYSSFPFRIRSDEAGITCENFFLSKKILRIEFADIDGISGGMFSGWNTRPVYIHDSKQNISIGFFAQGEFKELLKVILKNINEEFYTELLSKMKQMSALK